MVFFHGVFAQDLRKNASGVKLRVFNGERECSHAGMGEAHFLPEPEEVGMPAFRAESVEEMHMHTMYVTYALLSSGIRLCEEICHWLIVIIYFRVVFALCSPVVCKTTFCVGVVVGVLVCRRTETTVVLTIKYVKY